MNSSTINVRRRLIPVVLAALLAAPTADVLAVNPAIVYQQALDHVDELIGKFETALSKGADGPVREAALNLQRNPLAVLTVNQTGSPFLRERLNLVLDTTKANARNIAREQLAAHYGVPVEDVSFFEATNRSAVVKVGQDWDVTARVQGIDVPIDVARPILEGSYYQSVTGVATNDKAFAHAFAHDHAVEVINYKGTEAYGGSNTEGGRIINGPKDQRLRDPHQISDAIEVKSNVPRDNALKLEADGTPAAMADAQSQWMEEVRQYSKQYGKQIKPRVEAMGGQVPENIAYGSEILEEIASGKITLPEGVALLDQMGETPHSMIGKGAKLVEAAQTLRAPSEAGPAAPDVFTENVEGQLKLKQLETKAELARGESAKTAGTGTSEVKAPGASEGKPIGAEVVAETVDGAKPAKPGATSSAGKNGGAVENGPKAGKSESAVKPGESAAEVAGGATSAHGPSASKVAEGVGAGLTIANLYIDYQACLDEGRSDCMKELVFAAGQLGLVTGVGGVGMETLLALGLSESVIAAASAGMAAAGVPLAIYGVYKAGERWANAPDTVAQAGLRQEQKDLLLGFARLQQKVEVRIFNLQGLRARSAALCDKIGQQLQDAQGYDFTSEDLRVQLQTVLPSALQAAADCNQSQGIATDIDNLQSPTHERETRAIDALDRANALADQCKGKADADQIVQLYSDSQALAARMQADAAIARGRGDRLDRIAAAAADARARYQTAQELRDQLGGFNVRLAQSVAAAVANQEQRSPLAATIANEQNAIAARIKELDRLMPERAPSPVFQQEFNDAKNRQASLADSLAEASGEIACANEAWAATRQKLRSEQRYSAANASVDDASHAVDACAGVGSRASIVDEIAASANWALAAVGMNDTLPQRAASCLAGVAGGALPQCPTNSTAVWNNTSQQTQCRCNAGYKVDGATCVADKKPEPVNVACNTASKAGANPPETINVAVGNNPGTAQFSYDMYVEPDQMIVQYGGQTLIDTGCVAGSKTIPLTLNGSANQVTISVKPSCRGNGATTQWAFTIGCPSQTVAGTATSTLVSGAQPASAVKADFGRLMPESVSGTVRYSIASAPDLRPVTDPSVIRPGVTLRLERDASVVLSSRSATQVTLNGNSEATLGEVENGRQVVLLQSGSLEVKHTPIKSQPDYVIVRTENGNISADGTHYRVERTWRGTEVRVFEGSVHLSGDYIIRTYAPNVEAGKPSPVQDMHLTVNQQALMASIAFGKADPSIVRATGASIATGTPASPISHNTATPVVSRTVPALPPQPLPNVAVYAPIARNAPGATPAPVEPWDQPQIQQWIDEWLRSAIPPVDDKLPGPWHYSEWAQALGPGSRTTGAPDHPAGWSRYQSLWAKRMQFDSRNLCTLGEFIERRNAGKNLAGCDKPTALPTWISAPQSPQKTPEVSSAVKVAKTIEAARTEVASTPAAPSWIASPAMTTSAGPSGQRAANAIIAARNEVAHAAPPAQPVAVAPAAAIDFSGAWGCTLSDANGQSALFPTITRVANGYRVSTLTSGTLGMIEASSISADGNRIRAVHQVRDGTVTLQLERNGNVLSGSYLAHWNNGQNDTIPMRCELQVGQPATVPPEPKIDRGRKDGKK